MDYWNWVDMYKPIVNQFDSSAAIDGKLFLPFGKQWEFVSQYNVENIWTLSVTDLDDSEDTLWGISNGVHFVNTEGFLVTGIPCTENLFVEY
jgi:hypothetical protein